jgi:hypothetical protein
MLPMEWFCIVEILWLLAFVAAIWLPSLSPKGSHFAPLTLRTGVAAAALGLYSAYDIRWMPSRTLRFVGFPYPAFIWQLENGKWVDYVGSAITAAMDVALFVSVATLPLLIWSAIRKVKNGSRRALGVHR